MSASGWRTCGWAKAVRKRLSNSSITSTVNSSTSLFKSLTRASVAYKLSESPFFSSSKLNTFLSNRVFSESYLCRFYFNKSRSPWHIFKLSSDSFNWVSSWLCSPTTLPTSLSAIWVRSEAQTIRFNSNQSLPQTHWSNLLRISHPRSFVQNPINQIPRIPTSSNRHINIRISSLLTFLVAPPRSNGWRAALPRQTNLKAHNRSMLGFLGRWKLSRWRRLSLLDGNNSGGRNTIVGSQVIGWSRNERPCFRFY